MTDTEGQTKFVRLELPLDVHDRLRILAAANRQPMSQYVRQLVEEFVRKANPKPGKGKPS